MKYVLIMYIASSAILSGAAFDVPYARSKSQPEQLAGLMLLPHEFHEAMIESVRSPERSRSRGSRLSSSSTSLEKIYTEGKDPLSVSAERKLVGRSLSSSSLARVVSLGMCNKVMDERDVEKQALRAHLTFQEQRIFDAVGLKNLEFIKEQPDLLKMLSDALNHEIGFLYQAYLRSTILVLQKKTKSKNNLRDVSDEILSVMKTEIQDDLSPHPYDSEKLFFSRKQRQLNLSSAKRARDLSIGDQLIVAESVEGSPAIDACISSLPAYQV